RLGRVDADDLAVGIEEGSTAVTRVDGRVGLDEVVQAAGADVDRAAEAGDDAGGNAVRVLAEGVADGDRELADLQVARITEGCGRQSRGLDLDDREVRERVDAIDRAR